MKFTKMQGAGNDYVYVNCFEETVEDPVGTAIRVSDRHFGIGSDGLVLICPSETADVKMRMFNADGSEGIMCGNAIRCVGKYVYDRKIVTGRQVRVETLGGIKILDLETEGERQSAQRWIWECRRSPPQYRSLSPSTARRRGLWESIWEIPTRCISVGTSIPWIWRR